MTKKWQEGARVRVAPSGMLASRRPRGGYSTGTVVAVDARGVTVRFDRPRHGVETCYATADELEAISR